MAGVYWIGQDGNVWWASPSGTKNMGKPMGNPNDPNSGTNWNNGADTTMASFEAQRIDDPVVAKRNAELAMGGGGGDSGPTYQDTSAARAGTQASIDSLDTILNNKLTQAQGEYDALLGTYGEEEAQNSERYTKNVQSNEGNREAQQQAALLAAANGGRGLYSTLASIGALGGTGKLLANRAVSNEANLDIGSANKTFDTNATNLFDSYGAVKKQEEQRRKDAELTLKKTKQQHDYDITTERQKLLKDMADLWSKAGNSGEANAALGRAQGLTGRIAEGSRPNVPEYARTPLQFAAPELQGYLAGANDMTVNTSAGSGLPINGAIYTSTKKRDKL